MTEESKSEDIAARIAELTATNEFVGRSIDSFTDDELQSLLKESLVQVINYFVDNSLFCGQNIYCVE